MDSFITDFYTAKEFSFGQMVLFIKESLPIIESQGKEPISGLMEASTKDKLKMDWDMALVSIW